MKYFLWLFLVLIPTLSYADPANDLFIEGVGELASGRPDSAIEIWEKVYKIKPSAEVLSFLAKAASRAGRPDQASKYIGKMFSKHSAEEVAPFKQKAQASLAAFHRQSKAINFAKNTREIQIVERARLREESKTFKTWTWMGWTGTVMTLLGGAGVVTAALLNDGTVERQNELKQARNVDEYDSRFDDLNSHKSNQQLALVGGASLVAIGAVLIIWDLSTTTESYSVDLAFDAHRIGGNVTWKF